MWSTEAYVELILRLCILDRAKVLKHHPDKRSLKGQHVVCVDEDYFTCIIKAYEQLGISELKRRAYDSVDPLFDDSIPDEKQINSSNFFETFNCVFQRNSRYVYRIDLQPRAKSVCCL